MDNKTLVALVMKKAQEEIGRLEAEVNRLKNSLADQLLSSYANCDTSLKLAQTQAKHEGFSAAVSMFKVIVAD